MTRFLQHDKGVLPSYLFRYSTSFSYLKISFLVIITFCTQTSFAQLEASRWYFGNSLGLNFSSGSPTTLVQAFPNQHMDETDEGHATICDSAGNYLFYTNGIYVWDKNYAVMYNGGDATGDGLNLKGHWSSSQCATIFPLPGSKTKYVIITTPETQDNTNTICYNIVDLNSATNGGHATGALTTKNTSMPGAPTQAAEALASCPHFNGRDAWVVGHDKNGAGATNFYAWKVSANSSGTTISISAPVVTSIGDPINAGTWPYYGISVLKFNSCFNRLAMNFYDNAITQVFKFDNATGIVSTYPGLSDVATGPLRLDNSATADGSTGDSQHTYGLEFAPNGKYLYVAQSGESSSKVRVYQYDLQPATLSQANIRAGRKTLLSVDDGSAGVRIGHLQLAIDQKIYLTHFVAWNRGGTNASKLSVIASPNTASPAGFSLMPASLSWSNTTTRTSMGLPSFHKGFLAGYTKLSAADSTGTTSVSDLGQICVGQAFKFDNTYSGSGANYTWDMDAPATPLKVPPSYGTANGGATAYHKYTVAGDYLIVTTVDDAICGYTVRDTAKITVKPTSQAIPTFVCSNPNINFSVSNAVAGKTYVWYSDAALTQPFAIGSTTTKPYPTATVYVKEVSSASTSSVMTDPGSPAVPPTTYNNQIVASTYSGATPTVSSSGAPLITSLTATQSITLNSFKFDIRGAFYITGSTTCNYYINIKNASSVSVHSGSLLNQLIEAGTIPIGFTYTVPGGATLTAGTNTVELYCNCATGSNAKDIRVYSTYSPTTTAASALTLTGNSAIHDVNVSYTTPAIAAIPPTYTTVYTISPLACSYTSSLNIDCILPVNFLTINVDQNRLVSWSTATEINNSYFVVEKSYDGITFEAIGKVAGAGNSTTVRSYSYQDRNDGVSDGYYRIKQVDINGNYNYSAVVYIGNLDKILVSVYPNPNNGEFTVRTYGVEDASIEVLNILGTVVYSNPKIQNVMSVNLTDLAKGTYFLRVSGESKSSVVKFVID